MALWTGIPGIGCGYQPPTEHPAIPGKALRCRAQSVDFERKISTRFTLPDEVLVDRDEIVQQSSTFLELPHEVLFDIFEVLCHAPSQIGLALTCKQMARIAQRVDLGLSASSARYAGFLPPSVFDVPDLMSSLRPWMPSGLKFCGHCLTYRPHDSDYWHTIDGFERYDFWVQKVGWTFKEARWRKQTHDICPACHSSCSISDYVPCDGK